MKSVVSTLVLASFTSVVIVASVGCGDDTTSTSGGGEGGAPSTSSTGSSPGTTGGSTTTGGEGGEGGAGGGTPAAVTGTGTGGAGGGGAGGEGAGGGEPVDCDALPAGPYAPTLFYDGFAGSEDIAFDGLGHLAGKRGDQFILVDADLNESVIPSEDLLDAYGTRFAPDGSLIAALPGVGEVIAVEPDGFAYVVADDFSGPNGIHVTMDGTIWVTELPAGRIRTIAPGAGYGEPFLPAGEAPAVNGIVVDEDRGIVFFTNYSQGELWRVDVAATEEPVLVASIDGAALDGLTMDVCGNIYAVDQGNARVFRVRTDAAGDAVGDAELIAQLASNVANAQFGRGAGFSPTTLYAAGNPGDVYAIDVGVEGAAQAGPDR